MTPEQLREDYPTIARMAKAALNETVGYQKYALEGEARKLFIAHAAALEELARVKKAISESCDEQRGEYFGCRRAERAEAALAESERKCGRLKFHAEAMAAHISDFDPYAKYDQVPCLRAYRDEFKE